MANIKSQIKRNRAERSCARAQQVREVGAEVRRAQLPRGRRRRRRRAGAGARRGRRRKLDKAASAGVIHKNQAANNKSAINKKAASL